jgi:hypothetical protein
MLLACRGNILSKRGDIDMSTRIQGLSQERMETCVQASGRGAQGAVFFGHSVLHGSAQDQQQNGDGPRGHYGSTAHAQFYIR